MDKIINFKLSEVLCFLYALLIVLSSFQYTGLMLVWLAILIFPYLIINFKYVLSQKYEARISSLLIIALIAFQLAENLINVIQLFNPDFITYATTTLKSLFITFKGISFLIISIQIIRKKSCKELSLLKVNLFLLGGFYIVLGMISQITTFSYIAKLGVPPNALFIVLIFLQLLYIMFMFLLGVLFRNNKISITN